MRVSGNRRARGGRSNSGNNRSGSSGGRSGGNRRSNNGNRSYDSNGPDGKIRGSATQVYDKYMTLGRDAQTSGDHVGAENYYQHAEHYYRIMLANNLVKLDKQEDNTQDDKASSEAEGEAVKLNKDGTVMEDGEKEAAEATEESAETTEEAPQEPMIVDLSEAEASDAEDGEADTSDEAEVIEINIADGSAEEGDEEKPKSKRRVSRTRGLRRRTSRRRSSETESEEG